MQKIKVIIGASYGDEGKGLATDFFGAQVPGKRDAVNVLTNGGPQRGHTVELPDGRRHVFKHFGAASFRGAATYYAEQFLVNPMEFNREYDALCDLHAAPEAYVNPLCRFTTPWDMLVNQLLLKKRGIHNSCGFGIWETVLRYNRGVGIPFRSFSGMSREDRITYLRTLRDGYFVRRLRELDLAGPAGTPELSGAGTGLADFFFKDEMLLNFEADFETMRHLCPMRESGYLKTYQTVLFENAQGLMLDGNAKEEKKFTTPSTTGAGRVIQAVESTFRGADVELCYVTRSYLTRHGDGSMPGEINRDQMRALLPGIREDVTNVENRFQGNLRYGMMDVDLLAARIERDLTHCAGAAGNHYHPSVMVTHMNEFAGIDTDRLARRFGTLYLSDGRTDRDVFKSVCGSTRNDIFRETGKENIRHAVRTTISA